MAQDAQQAFVRFYRAKKDVATQVEALRQQISALDKARLNKERAIRQQLEAQDKLMVQVSSSNSNGSVSARVKQNFRYDVPTLDMLMELDFDWQAVKRLDAEKAEAYLFKIIQQARRVGTPALDIKICGKRNRKTYEELDHPELTKAIKECFKLKRLASEKRAEKKALERQCPDEVAERCLAALLQTNQVEQSVKLEGGTKLRIYREPKARNASVSGKKLRPLIRQAFVASQTKKQFCQSIMTNIHGLFKAGNSQPTNYALKYAIVR